MKRVLIVGGGASGLMAAITAAKNGAAVTVLEKNSQVGKKILVTGNGRCNLTNTDQEPAHYRCADPEFPRRALACFGEPETLEFFGELGILTRNRNGYLYPYSEQAKDVADILRQECVHYKVKLSCNTQIEKIEKKNGSFYVHTPGWTYESESLILACGSRASAGGSADGYAYAEGFGHRITPVLPALVQLRSDKSWPKELAGIRLDACVRLYAETAENKRQLLSEDTGEVQLTAYGISGIPVFQVSRYAARALHEGRKAEAELTFLPLFSASELEKFLKKRVKRNGYRPAAAWLAGLFPQKLIPVLLKRAGIAGTKEAGSLTEAELQHLAETIRCFRVPITDTNGFEQAQICTGGVDVSGIEAETMESRLIPGLYITGELLDVDGACGGYNLQWAWTSGRLAGMHAAQI